MIYFVQTVQNGNTRLPYREKTQKRRTAMKKKLIIIAVAVIVLGTVLYIVSGYVALSRSKVDKIVIRGSHAYEYTLTEDETKEFIKLYRKAKYAAWRVYDVGTTIQFGAVVYLKNGKKLCVGSFGTKKFDFEVVLRNKSGKKCYNLYYLKGNELRDFLNAKGGEYFGEAFAP